MSRTTNAWLKAAIRRYVPVATRWLDPWLERRYERRMDRVRTVRAAVVGRYGLTVQSGPFKGLRYVEKAVNSGFAAKIIGCYEDEIAPAVEDAIARGFQTFVDVGSAEGYYAAGIAMRCPQAAVYAYDTDSTARALTQQLAQANGLESRVVVGGTCTPDTLNALPQSPTFLISDCEGYEDVLLDPEKVPQLARWDILVELHEVQAPGVTQRIRGRFGPTHDIRTIDSVWRDGSNYQLASFLSAADATLAVDDLRSTAQQWFYMTSRQRVAIPS